MRQLPLLLLLWWGANTYAVIYECTDHSGAKTFTDQGCPSNSRIYPLDQEAPVAFAPLADSEHERLQELAAAAAKARRLAQSKRLRNRAKQAEQSNARDAACEQASDALEDLERLRRKGYPLAKQAQLDQARRQLKAKRKANC